MTEAQATMLIALQWSGTASTLARRTAQAPATAQHTLDGLYRRSLATLDTRTGRWGLTDRGSRAVLRILTREETPA